MTLLRRGLAIVLVLAGLLGLALVGRAALAPQPGAAQLTAQTTFLQHALDDGAGPEMQQYFPEGEFFAHVLTGLAQTRDPATISDAREQLRIVSSPGVLAVFGSGMMPEHEIFAHGWALDLAVAIAQTTADPADLAAAQDRAATVQEALTQELSPFPDSYPGQAWPCDAVVAAGALARLDALDARPGREAALRNWRERALTLVDPATQLLPHRVDQTGQALSGPRGSSQSIIQACWPDLSYRLDGGPDTATWVWFVDTFVTREAGLVGVREYPRGVDGEGDGDSGALVLGVSASASAVTLAAALRIGDLELAEALNRECELLGVPVQFAGTRRYALGMLPVGDAFVAWARSIQAGPVARTETTPANVIASGTPRPLWLGYAVPGLMLLALGAAAWPRRLSGSESTRR